MILTIQNTGQEITSTNYWDMEHAKKGYFYCSINAGAFRLLVPWLQEFSLNEMKTASEVIISRGPWPEGGKPDALEILFEDGTDTPFALHLGSEQVDHMPLDADRDRQGQPPRWVFSAWTQHGKKIELPCRYRKAKKIPCLKPF